ncbi:pentapeptide repeat-containing protein [Nonomuraea sp. NPDC001636]|uniref:pentapeptide repeat-containing protein n=1 Tax=Nonomuraea sp. NPDC001636 TaxID=3154391 RepID=UPI00331B44C0
MVGFVVEGVGGGVPEACDGRHESHPGRRRRQFRAGVRTPPTRRTPRPGAVPAHRPFRAPQRAGSPDGRREEGGPRRAARGHRRGVIGAERADVSGADVSGADVSGADVSGADVSGADVSGAVARGAVARGRTWCTGLTSR